MVKVFEGTEHEFYMDGYMQSNLDMAKEVIRKDWDMIFAVDGMEGSGKSVIAQQMAKYCDPEFDIEHMAFNPKEFVRAIKHAGKYRSVVYDEAYSGLNSRASMSFINRSLVSMLTEIRQKNLFVFIVMPCFFDLDKYVALWRSRALIHVYTGDNFQRGFFEFYNSEKKKDLYMKGKKLYEYNVTRPNFKGRFTNHYTVDEEMYRKLKHKALVRREKISEDAETYKMMKKLMFERLFKVEGVTHGVKMEILKMKPATYYRKLKRFKEEIALS